MMKRFRFVFLLFLSTMTLCGLAQRDKDIKWVRVEGGSFMMGCNRGEEDCYPDEEAHSVRVSSFEISAYEVTVAEYRRYCEQTGQNMPKEPLFGWQDDHPVVNVSWQQATDYAKWIGGRLPTEAEWEFAARGGVKSMGYKYSGSDNPFEVGWCYENSEASTHPVGTKQANELGIYDMSGNAWEWCSDNYGIYYYKESPKDNPKGPKEGLGKCNRGGCFNFDHKVMMSTHRRGCGDESIGIGTGFRVARDIRR